MNDERKTLTALAATDPTGAAALVRPRSTGEILDDAWRLALSDAPPLLALCGLFMMPVIVVMLFLLIQPRTAFLQSLLWPALFAIALPLTGLASGSCQALFRRRAEGKPIHLGGCMLEALGRGVDHALARSVVILLTLLGLPFLLMPGLAVWAAGATVHPLLATGDWRCFAALAEASKQGQRHAVKASAVTLSRFALLLLAFINLHALVRIALWVADQLMGFDVAMAGLVLESGNPVYDLSLLLLAWLLLAPYAEACNYLLYIDARARYEGLDLWYRVRRVFPATVKHLSAVLLLALATVAPARAADARLEALHAVRQEIGKIRQEVQAAEKYDNGRRWTLRLRSLGERLDREASSQRGRYQWFDRALDGFAKEDRAGALRILADLDRRLALIEESLSPPEPPGPGAKSKADVKALVPEAPDDSPQRPKTAPKRTEPKEKEPVRQDDPFTEKRQARQGSGVVQPTADAGSNPLIWLLLAGLLAAVVVAALLLGRRGKPAPKAATATVKAAATVPTLEALLSQADQQGGAALWRKADDLARAGHHLEAVRMLYLAVLALLHRADLIRYGPNRTNGEYVRQVRSRDAVHRPFRGLTGMFEVKWYGERACQADDYATCRRLAEQVRDGTLAPT